MICAYIKKALRLTWINIYCREYLCYEYYTIGITSAIINNNII